VTSNQHQPSAATESAICVPIDDAFSVLDDRTLNVGQLIGSELERIWKEMVTPLCCFFSVRSVRKIQDMNCKGTERNIMKDKANGKCV
jgi:hypothetical protein